MGNAPVRDDISMIAIEIDPSWAKFIELFNTGLKNPREKIRRSFGIFFTALKISSILSWLCNFQISFGVLSSGTNEKSVRHINIYLETIPEDKKALQQD